MNYHRLYNSIIDRARERKLSGYVERHHVVPRCMGGGNEPANLVELTAREHYVAHQLLVKMYPTNASLAVSANLMARTTKTGRAYGWVRAHMAELARGRAVFVESGRRAGKAGKGKSKVRTPEHNARIAQTKTGKPMKFTDPELRAHRIGIANKERRRQTLIAHSYQIPF